MSAGQEVVSDTGGVMRLRGEGGKAGLLLDPLQCLCGKVKEVKGDLRRARHRHECRAPGATFVCALRGADRRTLLEALC